MVRSTYHSADRFLACVAAYAYRRADLRKAQAGCHQINSLTCQNGRAPIRLYVRMSTMP